MTKRPVGADPALAVRLLRFLHDWTRGDLERESGVDRKRLYLYEKEKLTPTPAVLERLAAAANAPLAEVEPLIPSLRRLIRRAREGAPPEQTDAGLPRDRLLRAVNDAVEAALPRIVAASGARSAPPADRFAVLYRQLRAASGEAAATDADRAAKLARLAQRLAEREPGSHGS